MQQDKTSMSYQFFYRQVEQPSRVDWASSCFKNLKELKITESLEEIRKMSKTKFNKMLIERTRQNGLKYVTEKRRNKGKEILYP